MEDIFQPVAEFLGTLDELISKKASDDALSRIFDNNNEGLVKLGSLEIVNMVGARLKDRNSIEGDIGEWHNLQSMLEYVVTVSSPKEMLIGLMSLLEIAESDDFFKMVVRFLRMIFLRVPSQRGDTLLFALNGLHDYINQIPVPAYLPGLEEKEKLLLENSPELNRLESCVNVALDFCEPLVWEAKECKLITSNERRQEQVLAIASFLLKLIERPVSHFEFISTSISDGTKKVKLSREVCAEGLVEMLFALRENFLFVAIDWLETSRLSLVCCFTEDDDAKKRSKLVGPRAIGTLASLIYCYGMCFGRIPQIYNYEFVFERLLPYANALLKEGPNSSFMELGVQLLGVMSDRIYSQFNRKLGRTVFWEHQRLHLESYQRLFLNLLNVMTYSKSEPLRRYSLGLFTRFLGCFEPDGQMMVIRLVYHVFEKQEDDGVNCEWYFASKGICGYLIDFYRASLNAELNSNADSPFIRNIVPMLALFTKLRNLEESDFLDNFDQCMAALNLIRFLCIVHLNGRCRNLPANIFAQVSKDFVEPMRKGLELSKAHYELDLKNFQDDQRAKAQTTSPSCMTNTLDSTSNIEKINVLKSALYSFDLMMSLVARVAELLGSCQLNETQRS